MEAEWMKKISSNTICNFFYFFFVVYAIIFALTVVTVIGTAVSVKSSALYAPMLASTTMSTLIAGTMMLFYYLICDRALIAKEKETPASIPLYQ